MEYPKAMFKYPGAELIDGMGFDSRVVDSREQQREAEAEGWHETTDEAFAASEMAASAARADAADDEPPTREELEAKATELGIDFRSNISDKTLAERIAAKLAELEQ